MQVARMFIAGKWTEGGSVQQLHDKYDGGLLAEIHHANADQVRIALDGVREGQRSCKLTRYDRFTILSKAATLLEQRAVEFEQAIIDDTGFTVVDARREVERAKETLLISGEEAKRIHGEVVPIEGSPEAPNRRAFTVRNPVGVVCAITPFNSPLNTVAHKVGPALAAGNGVVLKPALMTPLTAGKFVELMIDAGLPQDLISLVYGRGETVGEWLLQSRVPDFYAFTGSTAVGEHIRRTIGLRRSQLELGSLASTIVCADASIDHALSLCTAAAFRKAGQVCTSVQRLYIHHDVFEEFAEGLAAVLSARQVGDPRDPCTFVGPVISGEEADRITDWIDRAVGAGAEVICGGRRRSRQVIEPTVVSGVREDMDLMCKEIFGPVVVLRPFEDLTNAITEANSTPYGLSAGIFTSDLHAALSAADGLRVGAVHINHTSSNRSDMMPFGGVKASGFGLEGPRYAIEEMTEQKLITFGPP